MKIWLLFSLSLALFGCASINNTTYRHVCFSSVEKAMAAGEGVIEAGFFNRVSYWIYGDPEIPVHSLGLMWDGFDHNLYCPVGEYPLILTYEDKDNRGNSEQVLKWSQIVLTKMLKEQGIEISH